MKNYVMIGAGGTGTHLLRPLVTYLRALHSDGDWLLHIVDGDIVESKNLERQAFAPGHVTMNKAEAAAQSMGDEGHVRAISSYLSEENMARIIQSGDIVFICVDNFTVRKKIEDHCLTLDAVAVINGGNERWSGSVQLWVRENGKNVTPRIGFMHPEVAVKLGEDRAEMTCVQAAALPGGEQTLLANITTATWMLTALWRYHHQAHVLSAKQAPGVLTWTEIQYDFLNAWVEHIDQRMSKYWDAT